MIESVAATLDKQQILSALTGAATSGAAARGTTHHQPVPIATLPRANTLKSKVSMELEVPSNMVGHLLGKAGQTVKDMVRQSKGARFTFQTVEDHSAGGGTEDMRTLTITGTFDQIQSAYRL